MPKYKDSPEVMAKRKKRKTERISSITGCGRYKSTFFVPSGLIPICVDLYS